LYEIVIDNAAVLSLAGSVLRAAALALLAVSLLAALPLTAIRVGRRISEVVSLAGEDARSARVRVLGASQAAALDAIRQIIPPDGEYLLVEGGEGWEGATYWVRFDLAPRRARFAGRLKDIMAGPSQRALSLPAGPRWVVVAFPRDPAVLLDRDDFLRRLEARDGPR
jgi:hypothetical protein